MKKVLELVAKGVKYGLTRLAEPSTKAGVYSLLALLGMAVSPEEYNAYWAVIIALANAWQVARKEQPAK